jgi:hypothetical protein
MEELKDKAILAPAVSGGIVHRYTANGTIRAGGRQYLRGQQIHVVPDSEDDRWYRSQGRRFTGPEIILANPEAQGEAARLAGLERTRREREQDEERSRLHAERDEAQQAAQQAQAERDQAAAAARSREEQLLLQIAELRAVAEQRGLLSGAVPEKAAEPAPPKAAEPAPPKAAEPAPEAERQDKRRKG